MENLRSRCLLPDAMCPRCGQGTESLMHVFCQCPVAVNLWYLVDLYWILTHNVQSWQEWLTGIFQGCSSDQCRLVCCTLSFLWYERSKKINDGLDRSSEEISKSIFHYLVEIDGIGAVKNRLVAVKDHWAPIEGKGVKINFDASFEAQRFRSGTGIVARDSDGRVIESKAVLHERVCSPFAAEALACLEAIKMGKEIGEDNTALEADSLTVVKKSRSGESDKSELGAYVKNIRFALQGLTSWSMQHIRRSANGLANRKLLRNA